MSEHSKEDLAAAEKYAWGNERKPKRKDGWFSQGECYELERRTPIENAYLAGIAHKEQECARLRAALELIATPKRSDGTYNRCREACEQLAREALDPKEHGGVGA